MTEKKIKVGISSCLLGERVRYDGRHKLSRLCTEELSRYFEYVSLCPELGIGMGVPRQPIHLVENMESSQALGVDDSTFDVTEQLGDYARVQAAGLTDICGYIFMEKSPSCGLFDVKLHNSDGRVVAHNGRGVFAREFSRALPHLPVEESERLQDPLLRKQFIERVFAYAALL